LKEEQNTHNKNDIKLSTLRKIDDFPLYEMYYKGDYKFEDYLKKGGSWPSLEAKPTCTCFAALSGKPIFGRNFDFPPNPVLVLHTAPPGKYASLSIVDLGYFGFNMKHHPNSGDMSKLLKTPYLPFDGMNERGVFVCMMAVPKAEGSKDAEKVTIGEIEVIRLILDYASNLDEAVDLMGEYNIEFTNPRIHYLIADKSGKSAVVEFLRGEMKVIRNTEPWQVATNFIITGSGAPVKIPCRRYRVVYDELKEKGGVLTRVEAMSLLQETSMRKVFWLRACTVWSAVYDPQAMEMGLSVGGNYSKVVSFRTCVR
jgi:predicted choloylglycine hydrolase